MKKLLGTSLLAAAALMLVGTSHAAPLVTYNFNDSTSTATRLAPTISGSNLTATSISNGVDTDTTRNLTNDVYDFTSPANNALNVTLTSGDYFGGNTDANADSALAAGHYFGFTVTADPTFKLSLDTVTFDHSRTSSAPRTTAVYASIDGSSSFTRIFKQGNNSKSSFDPYSITLSSAFGSIDSAEFRFVYFDNNASKGAGKYDNVVVNGAVVPEPTTFAMVLGGLGMLIGFQRTRRRA